MDWLNKLKDYLNSIFGRKIAIVALSKDTMQGLPLFLAQKYTPYQMDLLGQKVLILKQSKAEAGSPGRIAKDVSRLRNHFEKDFVLVIDRLASWERKRLIESGIAFIVPGRQLFLPMLLVDLREHFPKTLPEKPRHLSRAGQHALLRQILHGDVANQPMSKVATLLGYSAMTVTKIRRELVALDLCLLETQGRARQMVFPFPSKQLWLRSKPNMRSPVFRRRFVVGAVDEALISGPTALARQSMLQAGNVITRAMWKKEYADLLQEKKLIETDAEEESDFILEEWYYDPKKLSGTKLVDPLSLYLSLVEDPDERIQIALEEFLETVSWSKE